jgi:hypothetical protein
MKVASIQFSVVENNKNATLEKAFSYLPKGRFLPDIEKSIYLAITQKKPKFLHQVTILLL